MFNKIGRAICVYVLLAGSFILLVSSSSAMQTQAEEALNDKCIHCHADVYNKGIESPNRHQPCFEHRCIVCHLSPDSSWLTQAQSAGGTTATATGMPVADQGDQWRKTTFFTSQGSQTQHTATLLGLPDTKAFRFRIVLSDNQKPGAGQQIASEWLGLIPAQLQESSSTGELALKISGSAATSILSPTIESLGQEAVVVRWQSPSASFGWVELQDMEGLSLQQPTDTSASIQTSTQGSTNQEEEQHPLLVSSEYATIDLCYTCHPENGLGTSHPVRIYAKSKNTHIPASLPTGNNGMLTCVTCHDPHGSKSKALVRELIVTKLCVACHYTFNRTSKATMF